MRGVMYLLMFLLLVLQGCGGGGDSDKPSVKPGQTVAVLESLRIPEENLSQAAGFTTELTLRGIYSDGTDQNLDPERAEWHSSNPAVAMIDNGIVTCVSPGEAEITATLIGNVEISYTVSFTVTDSVLISLNIPGENLSQAAGLESDLTLEAIYSDGNTYNVTNEANWQSSNTDVATVNGGLVNCISPGITEITASFDEITINTQFKVLDASITEIDIYPHSKDINNFISIPFEAYAYFTDGEKRRITELATWSSSNPEIATVNNSEGTKGLVTTNAPGEFLIYADFNGVIGQEDAYVKDTFPVSMQIDLLDPEYPTNHSFPFTAKCLFSDGTYGDVTNESTWGSSNPQIATVDNTLQKGQVTSYETPGIVEITASWEANNELFTKTSVLDVRDILDLEVYYQRDIDYWRLYPLPEICDGSYCVEGIASVSTDDILIYKTYKLKANVDQTLTDIHAVALGLDEGYANINAWFNWPADFQPVNGELNLEAGDELIVTLECNPPAAGETAKIEWSFGIEGKEGIDGNQFLMTGYIWPE